MTRLTAPEAGPYTSVVEDLYILSPLAIPAGLLLAGAVMLKLAVRAFEAGDSPFAKIYADAAKVFGGDARLFLVPIVDVAGLLAIAAAALAAAKPGKDLALFMVPFLAGSVAAGCWVCGGAAALADYFVEWTLGGGRSFARAAGLAALRLWRLMLFTFLWTGLLAVLAFIGLKLHEVLRPLRGSGAVDAVMAAAFAVLDMGVTMAAALSLVLMVRDGLGPLDALLVTLDVAREEYGKTLGELARVQALDGAMLFLIMGTWSAVFAGAVAFDLTRWDPALATPPADVRLAWIILPPMAAALLMAVLYFVALQTLQVLLAAAVYAYLKEGVTAPGFVAADFDRVLGLRACGLKTLPRLARALGR